MTAEVATPSHATGQQQLSEDAELARLIDIFNSMNRVSHFCRIAGKVRPLSVTKDELICELIVEEEHINTKGTLHGGCAATLMDFVTARAVGVTVRDKSMLSVELSVSYMLPVKLGERIKLVAKVLKVGRSLAFAEISFIREDGKVAAKGKHTVALLPSDTTALTEKSTKN